jgi:hypothetical protein
MIPAQAEKDQRAALYDYIHGHIVTLCYRKNGFWLLYVHPILFSFTYPDASFSPETGWAPTTDTKPTLACMTE